MNSSENSTPTPGGASAAALASLSDHIEVEGGILAQVDAIRHMSVMLNEALQRKLAGPAHDESAKIAETGKARLGLVSAQFYVAEIDRFIWLAGELQERGQKLCNQVDELYDDLTSMGNAQGWEA